MSKKKKERGQGLAGVVELLIPGGDLRPGEPELDPKLDLISQSFKHVDEFIDDEAQPECLRVFLERARSPAHGRFGPGSEKPYPKLFATYTGQPWQGVNPGDRVRVTMASRMGDVGCTKNMDADHGYQLRCPVDSLTDFSAES